MTDHHQQRSPGKILSLSSAFWESCALHAAVKLDLFTLIGDGERTGGQVAVDLGGDERATTTLLNAAAAMGLLVKEGERFRCSELSRLYLVKSSPEYVGFVVLHNHHLVESWRRLDEAVLTGAPTRARVTEGGREAEREHFLLGMHNLATQLAGAWVPELELSGRRRLLDLGGGPGTWAIHFCQAHPELEAVVFDLPESRAFAEAKIAAAGLEGRVTFRGGDYHVDELGDAFDVIWVSQVLHSEGPEGCRALLGKAAAALEPGGLMMIHDFLLEEDLAGPLHPALFALNMLVGTPAGRAYSPGQIQEMLEAVGVSEVEALPMRSPNGSGVIRGFCRR